MKVASAAGYEEIAAAFIERTATLPFERVCEPILHLIPAAPSRVLDIGAGSGRDAAQLMERGHKVTAVEPTDALRQSGMALATHAEWLDDALPDLASLAGREGEFDLILTLAVWMHLDRDQRRRSMAAIAPLLAPGGVFALCVRHGLFPDSRRGFEVPAEETIEDARAEGLTCILHRDTRAIQEVNRSLGVTWTWLAFRSPQ